VSAQAVGGRAGELADLGQDPELTEAQRGCVPQRTAVIVPQTPVAARCIHRTA